MSNNAVFASTCPVCAGRGVEKGKTCDFCQGEGYVANPTGLNYHVPKNVALFTDKNGKLINSVEEHYRKEAAKPEKKDRHEPRSVKQSGVVIRLMGIGTSDAWYGGDKNRVVQNPKQAFFFKDEEDAKDVVTELRRRYAPVGVTVSTETQQRLVAANSNKRPPRTKQG